jgi:putative redox protein
MNQVNISANWVGPNLQFEAADAKGNTMKLGGGNFAPSHLLLVGLAGCMGMDVKSILDKKRQKVTSVEVLVTGHQPQKYPKPFQTIEVNFKVKGANIDPAAVERSIQLSYEKYCIVSQTIQGNSEIKTAYEISE